MSITYTIADYTAEDKTVEVTFEDENGNYHKRTVNIPKNTDGSIDENYFQEILEGQLRGVVNKLEVGAISMISPQSDEEPLQPIESEQSAD